MAKERHEYWPEPIPVSERFREEVGGDEVDDSTLLSHVADSLSTRFEVSEWEAARVPLEESRHDGHTATVTVPVNGEGNRGREYGLDAVPHPPEQPEELRLRVYREGRPRNPMTAQQDVTQIYNNIHMALNPRVPAQR